MSANIEPLNPAFPAGREAYSVQRMPDTEPNGSSLPTRHLVVLVRYAIIALCVGSAIALSMLLLFAPEQRLRLIAPAIMTLLALGGSTLLAAGRVRAAINLLAFGSWCGVTAVAIFTGGVRSPVVTAYPLVILMSGWLIGVRAALAVTAATVAVTIAFALGDAAALLPAPLPSSALVRAGDQIFVCLLAGALIMFLLQVFKNRLGELRSITATLAARSRELESSEAELCRAQAVARIGSWVYDIASGEMNFSEECRRILGLPDLRAGGYDAYLQLTHPADRHRVECEWHALLEGTPLDNEHRIDDAGTVRWIRQQAELEYDEDERPLRAVGIAQDITERKRAQLALKESEQRYRTMIEWTPEAIAVHRNGRFLYVNPAAARMIGARSAEMLVGRPVLDFVHPEFRPIVTARIGSLRESGMSAALIEEKFLKLDGSVIDVEVQTASIVYDGEMAIQVAMRDITERKRAEAAINSLAFYDTLTHLPNRRLLTDRLKQALASSIRTGSHGALLFVDLDNFKSVNDALGHAVGDQLLEQVARCLAACVREADTLARFGGDEFAIVLGDLGSDLQMAATQAEAFAERVLERLNQAFQLGPHVHHVTASAGIAMFPTGQESCDDLLQRADLALYQAAGAGRNTLRFFDPVTQAAVARRAALEDDLHEAIRNRQFVLYYQAQVVGSTRVTGAEALVRWLHPERGVVAPNEFIALAEESGLIVPLGRCLLEMACAQLQRWAGHPRTAELTLAVNVSARQFHDGGFVGQVFEILERTGANPHRLKIELTESVLVNDAEDVIAKMAALKARGVGFSLDDFGTGYSSLSYLRRLPLDQLKIDRSFIRNVLTDANDAAIAKTVIALADSLGLSVIAEGVELAAQRHFLARHGCHAFQGYLFSPPLPRPDFEQMLAAA